MDLQQYLKELEYLVNTDSCSDDPEGLNKVAGFFSERFKEMGWIVEEHDFTPECGTCVICKNREAEHYDLMLIGHLDTVFEKGTVAERPFKIDGNFAYGPGVADMKNGSLLMYYILKELPEEVNEKLNIVAVFNPDEEIGSRYSKSVYKKYADKCDYAYVYESCSKEGFRCAERKGGIGYNIEFEGKEGHCGFVFKNGARSAISEMARWIVRFDSLQSRERNTSVNIGVVSGGTKSNVVAKNAHMTVDMRIVSKDEIERAEITLNELLEEAKVHEIGVKVQKRVKAPLIPDEKTKAYLKHIEELTEKLGLEFKHEPRGGLSDANIIAESDVICLDGMGPMGSQGHSVDEYMLIDSVIPSFELSRALICDLAENK